jgi:hypothetical protein
VVVGPSVASRSDVARKAHKLVERKNRELLDNYFENNSKMVQNSCRRPLSLPDNVP